MPEKLFTPEQFTPTEFKTAKDKAKFANHFVRFVESGFKRTLFHKWFYRRLSTTFGNIAHYDIHGFYYIWFSTVERQEFFLRKSRLWGCFGSPQHTYCDVEKAIIEWLKVRLEIT